MLNIEFSIILFVSILTDVNTYIPSVRIKQNHYHTGSQLDIQRCQDNKKYDKCYKPKNSYKPDTYVFTITSTVDNQKVGKYLRVQIPKRNNKLS